MDETSGASRQPVDPGCGRPAWAEVDLTKIASNVRALHSLLPTASSLMAVVKANGYGHGAAEIATAALKAGASRLAVASLQEGMDLRRRGLTAPILILGYTDPQQTALLYEGKLTPTVFNEEGAQALAKRASALGCHLNFHFKVDTGMGRLGSADLRTGLQMLKNASILPGIRLEGVFTHFASADEPDRDYTERQIAFFQEFLNAAAEQGVPIPLRHAANTAAIIGYPEAALDMVRAGIGIYGYYPSPAVDRQKAYLQPAFTLKSRIVFLKRVTAGTPISYGGDYRAPQDTLIATVPLGYGDGLSRHLSRGGAMLVHGRRVPIAGRVCMDMTMLDVGALPEVKEGDEVVAYGCQEGGEIGVDEVAARLGTISYEILCRIGARIPRVYK